jgi:uroporphyrinogen decarboxylase
MNHPLEVMAALETITDTLMEYVEAQCDAGAVGVALDTLFASWNGLSRELWEQIEGPFVREIANAIRRRNKAVFVHNCGHGPYFDSQIRFMEPVTVSFAHLPDDCSDRKELKRRYGDQVLLVGHIGTPLLTYGAPYQVMEECKKQIEDLAPGGMGYVLAPGCEFPPNAPLENAMAILRAAELYG